jgi:hypothetical protein
MDVALAATAVGVVFLVVFALIVRLAVHAWRLDQRVVAYEEPADR